MCVLNHYVGLIYLPEKYFLFFFLQKVDKTFIYLNFKLLNSFLLRLCSIQCVLFFSGLCQQEEGCSKTVINSCNDCIRSGPSCVWCKQLVRVVYYYYLLYTAHARVQPTFTDKLQWLTGSILSVLAGWGFVTKAFKPCIRRHFALEQLLFIIKQWWYIYIKRWLKTN